MGARGINAGKGRDEVTSDIINTASANMAQLGQMFRTDSKTLPKRLQGILPVAVRNGIRYYDIREAASRIVTPSYEIEHWIKQASPQELPPLLLKEFWNGQNARLKYEKELGNLWPTEDVMAFFGELTNALRMALLLVSDGVERETGLKPRQRRIIQRMIDGAIEELKKTVVEKFKDYHASRPTQVLVSYSPEEEGMEEEDDITALADEDDGGNILAAEDDEEDDIGI